MQPTTTNRSPRDGDVRWSGYPANLLSRMFKAEATITIDELGAEGDIKFHVPVRDIGLTRQALARTPSCRYAFFVNQMGDLLVRKNLARFANVLETIDPKDYDRIVNCYRHRNFGMMVDEKDVVRFTFHISYVQAILVEAIGEVFGS